MAANPLSAHVYILVDSKADFDGLPIAVSLKTALVKVFLASLLVNLQALFAFQFNSNLCVFQAYVLERICMLSLLPVK